MILAPLCTYFGCLNLLRGDTVRSAIAAVIVTNLVVAMYVVVAFLETDEGDVKVKET
jgi:hypothetical protein